MRRSDGVRIAVPGFQPFAAYDVVLANLVRLGLGWLKPAAGAWASWIVLALLAGAYVLILRIVAREPDLAVDDPGAPVVEVPALKETLLAGLHFLLPVALLIWSLLVETLSPGLSAFYATVFLIVILLTQKPLTAMFRRRPVTVALARAVVPACVICNAHRAVGTRGEGSIVPCKCNRGREGAGGKERPAQGAGSRV